MRETTKKKTWDQIYAWNIYLYAKVEVNMLHTSSREHIGSNIEGPEPFFFSCIVLISSSTKNKLTLDIQHPPKYLVRIGVWNP